MQTGFTELFSTQGSNTLEKFKLNSISKLPLEKQIQKIYDKELKNFIVQIFQSTTKIRFPKQDKESLGITHRYFIVQLCADSNDLYIEFLIKDTQMNRRRIIFSSSFGKISCNPLHAQFPLTNDLVPRNVWCNIAFDLESLVSFAFVSQSIQFHCLEQVLLGGLCKIRKVFCSKMSPISEVILPKTLQFVSGVSYETKLVDYSTFGGNTNSTSESNSSSATTTTGTTEQHQHPSSITTSDKSPTVARPKTTAMMQSNKVQQQQQTVNHLFTQAISPQKLSKPKKPATAVGTNRLNGKQPLKTTTATTATTTTNTSFGRYSNEEEDFSKHQLIVDTIKVPYEEDNYVPFHQKQNKVTIPSNELYNSQMYSMPSTENGNSSSSSSLLSSTHSLNQKSSTVSSQQIEKSISDQPIRNYLEHSPPKLLQQPQHVEQDDEEDEEHPISSTNFRTDVNSFDELVNFTNSDSEEEVETKISREKTTSPVLSNKGSEEEEEEVEHVIHSFSRKPLVELESEGEEEEEINPNYQNSVTEEEEEEEQEQRHSNSYLNYTEEEQYEQDEEDDFSVEQQQQHQSSHSHNQPLSTEMEEEEEDIELIYDPALNCYYDVKNNKYYALKSG